MIHRRHEGQPIRQGISWGRDEYTWFMLIIKIGLLGFYLRRRTNFVMAAGTKERYLWGLWVSSWDTGHMMTNEFDSRTLRFGKRRYSWDYIEMLLAEAERVKNSSPSVSEGELGD